MKKLVLIVVAVAFSFSLGCSKSSSDPLEAMIGHTKAMLQIIKDNKADCNKVVSRRNSTRSRSRARRWRRACPTRTRKHTPRRP